MSRQSLKKRLHCWQKLTVVVGLLYASDMTFWNYQINVEWTFHYSPWIPKPRQLTEHRKPYESSSYEKRTSQQHELQADSGSKIKQIFIFYYSSYSVQLTPTATRTQLILQMSILFSSLTYDGVSTSLGTGRLPANGTALCH